jgi:hypothetical protein
VSIFWSPLLVNVAEKAELAGVRHNNVFLYSFNERWMSQLGALEAGMELARRRLEAGRRRLLELPPPPLRLRAE